MSGLHPVGLIGTNLMNTNGQCQSSPMQSRQGYFLTQAGEQAAVYLPVAVTRAPMYDLSLLTAQARRPVHNWQLWCLEGVSGWDSSGVCHGRHGQATFCL